MTRFLAYLLLFGGTLYFLTWWGKRQELAGTFPTKDEPVKKFNKRFKPKRNPWDAWVQVYDTDSQPEAQMLQARLQEEEIDCILYEQGKKDIHGNPLKGFGIAVPKTQTPHAQNIINRMPV